MNSQEKSAALSADPRSEGGGPDELRLASDSLPPSSALARCRATLHVLDQPLAASRSTSPSAKKRRRPRCIHPAGHWGPHFFGRADA